MAWVAAVMDRVRSPGRGAGGAWSPVATSWRDAFRFLRSSRRDPGGLAPTENTRALSGSQASEATTGAWRTLETSRRLYGVPGPITSTPNAETGLGPRVAEVGANWSR